MNQAEKKIIKIMLDNPPRSITYNYVEQLKMCIRYTLRTKYGSDVIGQHFAGPLACKISMSYKPTENERKQMNRMRLKCIPKQTGPSCTEIEHVVCEALESVGLIHKPDEIVYMLTKKVLSDKQYFCIELLSLW